MPQPVIASRYRLECLIGRGSCGAVFRGTDLHNGAAVAVKILAPVAAGSASPTDPLAREIAAARRLSHPGIAAILDTGRSQGQAWLVMDLARGAPLSRYVATSLQLPEALALRVGARIALALAHAHAQGVVHRDLKPSNVMLDLPSGQVTLLDFGLARIEDSQATRTGMTLGTPSYMAPEQLAGAPASAASDTYALGVLLFEMLTGERPHQGDTLGKLLRSIASAAAADLRTRRPDLPGPICVAVQRALARDPAHRPADLLAYAAQLEALADGLQTGPPR